MVGQTLEKNGVLKGKIKNSLGHENEKQTKTYMRNDQSINVESTAKLIYNKLRIG